MSAASLYQLDPLNRFRDRATDYAKHRPSYPAEAIDKIVAGLPIAGAIADVGAGTGISSRVLGDRGFSVIAIEPNVEMRNAAVAHPQVQYRPANAENTGLPDASVDLVTCFQAFHWFEPETALAEFHRILKPGGRLALVWNKRDESDEFTGMYGDLLRVATNKHPALEKMVNDRALIASALFMNAERSSLASEQLLDLSGLKGASTSRSYVPLAGEKFETLMRELDKLYDRFQVNGWVSMKHTTEVTIAQAAPVSA